LNVVRISTLAVSALFSAGIADPSAIPSGRAQFTAYHADVDREFDAMLRYVTTPPKVACDATVQAGSTDLGTPPAVTQAAVPKSGQARDAAPPNVVGDTAVQTGTSDPAARGPAAQAPGVNRDQAKEDAALDSALSARLASDPGLKSALKRLHKIRPELEDILRKEGVPPRFAAMVLVESGAKPSAQSPKSARGLWQLIPETARRYGLVVNKRRDDRMNLKLATRAAARYLHDLYCKFGTWRLALAAYNAGEGLVQRALDKAENANFQELSRRKLIPAETRKYVPRVLAIADLLVMAGPR